MATQVKKRGRPPGGKWGQRPESAICPVCLQSYRPKPADYSPGWTRTCSYACANQARWVQSTSPKKGRTCEVCGEAYDASYPRQRTCGRVCGNMINSDVQRKRLGAKPRYSRVWIRNCDYCDQVFIGRTPIRRFCSDRCGWRWENARKPKAPPHPCPACGQLARARTKWCDDCRDRETRRRRREVTRQQRRAKAGALRDPIRYTLWEIAERDGFTCGSCGLGVNMFLSGNARMGPTIDHIVPFSVSLDDRRANVQIMHRACNEAKGISENPQKPVRRPKNDGNG